MRNLSGTVAAVLIAAVGAVPDAGAQTLTVGREIVRDTVISVNASRITRLAPDRVSFWVIIDGTAETAADAIARVDLKQKTVGDALNKLGSVVTSEKPMLMTVGTAQNNGYPPSMPQMQSAKSVIRVTVSQPERVASVVSAAVSAGASGVSSYQYESTGADAARRAKYEEVLAIAKADAEAVAKALGGKLGSLVDVSASGSNQNFFGPSQLNLDSRFSGGSSMAPEISVTTSVSVRFKVVR